MRVSTLACPLLAACTFPHGVAAGDGNRDTSNPDDCSAWHARHFDACAIPMSSDDIHLASAASPLTYDTTTAGGTLKDRSGTAIAITSIDYTQPGDVHAALWVVASLTIDQGVELDIIGSKPLIVASWGTITINGTLDAGSYWNGRVGAGANPSACASHAATRGGDGLSGTGGGGGGGYGGNGAQGGNGDSNCTASPPACERAGGTRGGAVPAPAIVLGGCDGSSSGLSGTTFAAGGRGGGALLLAARASITITGTLLAAGAGGSADNSSSVSLGGGGGGAGGFLGLDAIAVDITGATLLANGGAGGAGADIANTGSHGGDGIAGAAAAVGGVTGGGGTNGGSGSSQADLDGSTAPGAVPVGGGGGGGGGAGFVLYWTATLRAGGGGTTSPPPNAGP